MHLVNDRRLTIAWLVLSAITLLSLALMPPDAHAALPNATLTISVIVVSLVKVRLVLREFMEVRHTPALLKGLTDLWVVVTGVALVGAYFAGHAL
jgi:hypothetical protein